MTEGESPSAKHTPDSSQSQQAPYESTLARLVERIKDESLLFVIAVCVLFVGLGALAGDSPYLRFIAAIIALLAFTGVIIHFVQGELKYRRLSLAKKGLSSREKYKAVIESNEAQRFWQPFVEDELQVVTGRFRQFGSFEPTGLVVWEVRWH